MELLSDYDKTELRGRGYIQQLYPSQTFDFSELKEKASWDVSGQTQNGAFLGEIKIRHIDHNDFDTGFLEVLKYEKLKEISANNGNLPVFYFNVYKDKTLVYNLSKLPVSSYEVKDVWCPKTYEEDNGGMFKPMIHLPIKDASSIKEFGYQRLKKVI
jgi:hypothetical protein